MGAQAVYDAGRQALALDDLAPGASRWGIAPTHELSDALGELAPELDGVAALDEAPRLALAQLPLDATVVVASSASHPSRVLAVLRRLRVHRGAVGQLVAVASRRASSAAAGLAHVVPADRLTLGAAQADRRSDAHQVRLRVGATVAMALVHAPRRHTATAAVRGAPRRAALSGLPLLATHGERARSLAEGSPRVTPMAPQRPSPDAAAEREREHPSLTIIAGDAAPPRARQGLTAPPMVAVGPSGQQRVRYDPHVDRPGRLQTTPGDERLTVDPRQPLPRDGARWSAVVVPSELAAPRAVAATVVAAAARGWLPMVQPDTASVGPAALASWREHLGPATLAAVDEAADLDPSDPDARERCIVALLRAVRHEHHPDAVLAHELQAAGALRPQHPSVSVLMATARPDFLSHAVSQIRAQRHRPLELVVVAHGDPAAQALRQLDPEQLGDLSLTACEVASDAPLGAALNVGVDAASGTVVTKMDDDDWYGPDHIGDCVAALRDSGAPIVGKAAEFTYLAPWDLTLRRVAGGERYGDLISGATLTLLRDDLRDLGGFAPVWRGEDRRLLAAVLRSGERPYRVHGLQFVVNRHGGHSAWSVGADHFLSRARRRWRGFAAHAADVAGPDASSEVQAIVEDPRLGRGA